MGTGTELSPQTCENQSDAILDELSALRAQVSSLESLIVSLSRRLNSKADPSVVSWSEAARMLGLSGQNPPRAAKARIERERAKVNGLIVKTLHGGVDRLDFLRFIESQKTKHAGAGTKVRQALRTLSEVTR